MADAPDPLRSLTVDQIRQVVEQALQAPEIPPAEQVVPPNPTPPVLYDPHGRPARGLFTGPTGWMPVGDPLRQVAPVGTPPRQFQTPISVNRFVIPRGTEPIGFPELRAMSRRATLVRLAIETCKDIPEAYGWQVVPKPGRKVKDNDSRIDEVQSFLERPDGKLTFHRWCRKWREDYLALDAPAVGIRRTVKGEPYSFDTYDGSAIKPLVDVTARTPVAGPAYELVLYGQKQAEFTAKQLLYMPRNPSTDRLYGFPPTEQLLVIAAAVMARELRMLLYDTEGNIPDVFVRVPKDWTPDQVERSQTWFDQRKGDQQARTGIMVVPESGIQEMKEPPGKVEKDEWFARYVCWAFSLSPLVFLRQGMNRATGKVLQDTALDEGLIPRQVYESEFLSALIELAWGFDDLTVGWMEARDSDPQIAAQIAEIHLKTGVKSINEIRDDLKLDPVAGGGIPTITVGNTLVRLDDLAAGKYTPLSPQEQEQIKQEAQAKIASNGTGQAPPSEGPGGNAPDKKSAANAPATPAENQPKATPAKPLNKRARRTVQTIPKRQRNFWLAERETPPPRARPSDAWRGT